MKKEKIRNLSINLNSLPYLKFNTSNSIILNVNFNTKKFTLNHPNKAKFIFIKYGTRITSLKKKLSRPHFIAKYDQGYLIRITKNEKA